MNTPTSTQQNTPSSPSTEHEQASPDESASDQEGHVAEVAARRSAPVHRLSYGRLQASIWRNELRDGSVNYTVTLRRSYTDAGDVWRDSTSFGRDDLLVIAKLSSEAHSVIHALQRRARQRGQDEPQAGNQDEGDNRQDDAPAAANGNEVAQDEPRNGRATSDGASRRAVAASKGQRQR